MTPRARMEWSLEAAYTAMYRIRVFEAASMKMWRDGAIRGAMHLSEGQEAVAVGTCAALEDRDRLAPTYRSHAWALAWGLSPHELFAELLGRATGCLAGRGGSKHLGDWDRGLLPGNAIVGGHLPVACGIAFAAARLAESEGATPALTVAVFGDGALAQGVVHESFALATVYSLPIVFLCENNIYSELTLTAEVMPVSEIEERIRGTGLRFSACDGMGVAAVRDAVSDAATAARSGAGPAFVEARTYRFCGHHTGDGETYRDADEVARWKEKDPLIAAEADLTPDRVESVRARIEGEIETAASAALEDPLAHVRLDLVGEDR